MKIISIVGARPNFMKIAPFIHAIHKHNAQQETTNNKQQTTNNKQQTTNNKQINHLLVHTGQHYDDKMSKAFFRALNIPDADINLGIGSGTHAEQVGNTMIALEKVFEKEKPDWVIVVGDVNATLAASVTAKKLHIKVCHIEAGLRSGDIKMPEEINRLVTDRLSDLLLTPDTISVENLLKEGTPKEKIKFVGNIMIDTLETNREKASALSIEKVVKDNLLDEQFAHSPFIHRSLGEGGIATSPPPPFALMTLHRPSNVDKKEVFGPIINFLLDEVASDMPILWPIHPRAKKQLEKFGLWEKVANTDKLILLHPLGYHEMLRLNMDATIMLTDSGGLQEECTILGTPCLTLRWNTERPVTLREYGGASVLVGNNVDRIRKEYLETLKLDKRPDRPELWDGHTAERCVQEIVDF